MTVDTTSLLAKLAQAKKELVRNERPVKPGMGTTDIVLLPGWNPAHREVFWREFGGHYIKQGNKVLAFYPCDEVINNKPCPVCQKLAEAASMTTDDATLQLIREARSGREFLMNAIVVNSQNQNPVVFSLSKTAFEQMIDVITAWSTAVFDEKAPMIIRINRTGTGYDTRYTVTIVNQQYPLPPDIMSKVVDLDKYVDQKTDTLLQKSMNAIASFTGVHSALPMSAQPTQALTHDTFDSPADGTPWGGNSGNTAVPIQQQPVSAQPQMAQPVQPPIASQPIYAAPQAPVQPMAQPVTPPVQPQQPVQVDSDMEELLRQLNI